MGDCLQRCGRGALTKCPKSLLTVSQVDQGFILRNLFQFAELLREGKRVSCWLFWLLPTGVLVKICRVAVQPMLETQGRLPADGQFYAAIASDRIERILPVPRWRSEQSAAHVRLAP